jgi:hypothetical protein
VIFVPDPGRHWWSEVELSERFPDLGHGLRRRHDRRLLGPGRQLETETLPGGLTLTIGYDPARVATWRTYTRSSDGGVV